MFLVSDTSQARELRIRTLLQDDASLGALLAVVNLEWTIRRAIIALGSSPNLDLRESLRKCHGHQAFKDLWKLEVTPRTNRRLPEVVSNWENVQRAFKVRNTLVHAIRVVSADYATERAEWALTASHEIRAFAQSHGVDLDQRLPVRRRPRTQEA